MGACRQKSPVVKPDQHLRPRLTSCQGDEAITALLAAKPSWQWAPCRSGLVIPFQAISDVQIQSRYPQPRPEQPISGGKWDNPRTPNSVLQYALFPTGAQIGRRLGGKPVDLAGQSLFHACRDRNHSWPLDGRGAASSPLVVLHGVSWLVYGLSRAVVNCG